MNNTIVTELISDTLLVSFKENFIDVMIDVSYEGEFAYKIIDEDIYNKLLDRLSLDSIKYCVLKSIKKILLQKYDKNGLNLKDLQNNSTLDILDELRNRFNTNWISTFGIELVYCKLSNLKLKDEDMNEIKLMLSIFEKKSR